MAYVRLQTTGLALFAALPLSCMLMFSGCWKTVQAQGTIRTGVPLRAGRLIPASPLRNASVDPANQLPAGAEQAVAQPTSPGGATAVDGQAATPLTLEQKRVQALLQAKYDRTPPGILKAWKESRTTKPAPAAAEQAEPAKTIQAKVANSYKGFVVLADVTEPGLKVNQRVTAIVAGKPVGTLKVLSIKDQEVSAQFLEAEPGSSRPSAQNNQSTDTEPETKAEQGGGPEQGTPTNASASAASTPTSSTAQPEAPQTESENNAAKETQESGSAKTQDSASLEFPELEVGSQVVLKPVVDPQVTKDADEAKQVAAEIKQFTQDFTLGHWDKVKQYLDLIEDKNEADKVYSKILTELVSAMPNVNASQAAQQKSQMRQRGETPPSSFLTPADILAISDASPKPISSIVEEKESGESSAKQTFLR